MKNKKRILLCAMLASITFGVFEAGKQIEVSAKTNSSSIKNYGKVEKYGLPKGAPWMHVYVNGKETKTTLNNDKNAVIKLGDRDKIAFGGKLPLVGKVITDYYEVNKFSSDATLDEEENFDKSYMNNDSEGYIVARDLAVKQNKKLREKNFQDVQQYLAAVSANDPDQLPSQDETLRSGLELENMKQATYTYEIQELYFDKNWGKKDDSIKVNYRLTAKRGYTTELRSVVLAKVKRTEAKEDQYKNAMAKFRGEERNDKTETLIQEFDLTYYLNDDEWVLTTVYQSTYSRTRIKNLKDYYVKKVE